MTTMMVEPTDISNVRLWVIGAGGLLGSALRRTATGSEVFEAGPIPWRDGHSAISCLSDGLDRFFDQVPASDRWAIVWAAGAGVIATNPTHLADEASLFEAFVALLSQRAPVGSGGFLLASSASVYAGSVGPPFDETTPPAPLNAYGRTKLLQEEVAARLLADRVPFLAARISTLYGPGQRLHKPQGLISQMCLQSALNRPIPIFVPMDTLRDYLYVEDAAALVHSAVLRLVANAAPGILVLASQRSTTIGELVRVVQQVSRGRIGVTQRLGTNQSGHVRDLRVRSRYRLGATDPVPLPVGVRRVYDDILAQQRLGALASILATAEG